MLSLSFQHSLMAIRFAPVCMRRIAVLLNRRTYYMRTLVLSDSSLAASGWLLVKWSLGAGGRGG